MAVKFKWLAVSAFPDDGDRLTVAEMLCDGAAGSGRLVRIVGEVGGARVAFDVIGSSTVDGCTELEHAKPALRALPDGSLRSSRRVRCGPDQTWHPDAAVRAAEVTDTFFVGPDPPPGTSPSIGWNSSWSSDEPEMWTAPLVSSLTATSLSAAPTSWVGGPFSSKASLTAESSPLEPQPLGRCDGSSPAGRCLYYYGGALTDLQFHQNLVDTRRQNDELLDAPSMALPIAALLDRSQRAGFSFVQSAWDHPVSMTLSTAPTAARGTPGGALRFSRQYHRLGGGAPAVNFSQHLLLHEDCFRPALRWYDATYPDVLRVNPLIDPALIQGAVTSINYRGDAVAPAAAANGRRSGMAVINDLSLFEPFHGMWGPYPAILPKPQDDGASLRWSTCMPMAESFNAHAKKDPCWNPSYDEIKTWYEAYPLWSGNGHAFTYTNLFEFGWYSCPTCPAGGWDCSAFSLQDVAADTAGRSVAEVNQTLACYSKYLIDKLNISENQLVNPATRAPYVPPGCVGFSSVYDPGAEPYRSHLLEMLRTIMSHLANYSGGIVMDRWDFAGLTNPRADDGVTAYIRPPSVSKALPLQSTTMSLLRVMENISAIVHTQHRRAISINDHTYRVDLLKHVDHAGDEHGAFPARIHANGLAFMSKPFSLGHPPQELLYWGGFPAWSSTPARWGDGKAPFGETAIDYAEMFAQLAGKRWAGEAHAVKVVDGGPAQANLFVIEPKSPTSQTSVVSSGAAADEMTLIRVLVIVLGPARGNVTVALRGAVEYESVTYFHPGSITGKLTPPPNDQNTTTLTVPLSHGDPTGCAVVRLAPKAASVEP